MKPAEKEEQRELERMIYKQVKHRKREKDLFGEFEGAQAALYPYIHTRYENIYKCGKLLSLI